MPAYACSILGTGWLLWSIPFLLLLAKRSAGRPAKVDRRARWGILFIYASYALVWLGDLRAPSPAPWRIAASVLFLVGASVLAWTSTRALGRFWRLEAGLDADHKLVRSGPYRVIRHPIYTSMFCMLFGTGLLLATPLLLLLPSILLMATGTEIRVRIEDSLLASRFGEQFLEYQRRVPAYIPFIRRHG